MLIVDDVLEGLGVSRGGYDRPVGEAVIDSRQAGPGSLFVALPGEKADGHSYVTEAFQRGADLALVQEDIESTFDMLDLRPGAQATLPANLAYPLLLRVDDTLQALQELAKYWRAKSDVRVIGITGSVGKSTTKELTAEVLSRRFRTHKNPGNMNNEIGLPLTVLGLRESHQRAVLEMGFYVPGEIRMLCEIARPQVGVVTNISQVHLERAGSLEAIVAGKSELVESLPPEPEGVAILNHDDPLVRGMSEKTQARVFYYGLDDQADLWAEDIEGLGLEGVRFVLHYQGSHVHVRVPLLGRHSVHTALRAAAVGLVEGLTWQEIIGGLQDRHAQLRLLAVEGPQGALLLDDTYNAAPPSSIAALNLLDELEGRKVAVLGDMLELGEFEERGHRMVGSRAAEVVDELVVVGRRAAWIAEEAEHAGLGSPAISRLESSDEAVEYLQGRIGSGDVVLIKGSRSMAMDAIVTALEQSS